MALTKHMRLPTVLFNLIKLNPISNKIYLNPLSPFFFYLDLHQIVLTHRDQPHNYASFYQDPGIEN